MKGGNKMKKIFLSLLVLLGVTCITGCGTNKVNSTRIDCSYDGDLAFRTTYENGQYTYTYLDKEWAVQLTDKNSTEPVTTKLCTYINDYPVTDMSSMFSGSQATSIDLSSFNTSNVTNMQGMFSGINVTSLNLSGFDTSNVTNMGHMFWESKIKNLDLSNFNTSKVTTMSYMFYGNEIESLDISNFDFSNVKDLDSNVFFGFNLKTVYVKNQDTINTLSKISSKINFKVK